MSTAHALAWRFEPRPVRLESGPPQLLRRRSASSGVAGGLTPCTLRHDEALRRLERTWVIAARHGDRSAFERLWNRHASTVSAIVRAHGPARECRDLVQDVALSALEAIETLRDPERFTAWIASLARNRARDARRKRREPTACDPRELCAPASISESNSTDEAASALARVLRALSRISPCYREALRLRLVEGLSGPEIAQRTGRSLGSLRVHIHRGLKLLREILRAPA